MTLHDATADEFIAYIVKLLTDGPEAFSMRIKTNDMLFVDVPLLKSIHDGISADSPLKALQPTHFANVMENAQLFEKLYVEHGWHKTHPYVLCMLPSTKCEDHVSKGFMSFEEYLETRWRFRDDIGDDIDDVLAHLDYYEGHYDRMKERFDEAAARIKRGRSEGRRLQCLIDEHWSVHNNRNYPFIDFHLHHHRC